ncbi:MAG TPA: hypothetical protein VFE02_16885 [Candidatus Acidoferrales bacterium]|jgi:hypothetical protein|nr:hypothetical protein [Candidatus Acidoferrales bacterium]
MHVDLIRTSNTDCRVIFHHQPPESTLESYVDHFKTAGIKVPVSSIRKEMPAVATLPPTVTIVVTLEEYQYEHMIRRAFGEYETPPAVAEHGTI